MSNPTPSPDLFHFAQDFAAASDNGGDSDDDLPEDTHVCHDGLACPCQGDVDPAVEEG